jgi:hypothetical protein
MRRKEITLILLCFFLGGLLWVGGVADAARAEKKPTGTFLDDYGSLQKAKRVKRGEPREPDWWSGEGWMKLTQYKSISIPPFEIVKSEERINSIKLARSQAEAKVPQTIVEGLKINKMFQVSEPASGGELLLKGAIVEYAEGTPGKTIFGTTIPAVKIGMEAMVIDQSTKKVLLRFYHRRFGDTVDDAVVNLSSDIVSFLERK